VPVLRLLWQPSLFNPPPCALAKFATTLINMTTMLLGPTPRVKVLFITVFMAVSIA
jgi:hypothetical protein